MFPFILAIILGVVFVVAVVVAIASRYYKVVAGVVAAIALLLGGGSLFWSTYYANGVGEAQVMVNSVDRTVVGTVEEPGSGFKAPWVDFVPFDLFSQELLYAGNGDKEPSYTGGSVNGGEVTASVGGASGGSTQANVDISVTYSIKADAVKDIYSEYRSQERFTKQVIERTILSTIRSVPSAYSAIEFRGEARTEAADLILKSANEKLNDLGVDVEFVNIQDVRYPEAVEEALKGVEVANQKEQAAVAEQRAKEVEAQTLVIQAEAEAKANKVLTESLTPEVLEQRRIEALRVAAEKGQLIIDGSGAGILLQK